MVTKTRARRALEAWSAVSKEARLTPVTVGLINVTFRVDLPDGRAFALQRLAPIFGREVHQDIAAVTAHIARRGLVTPALVPTDQGDLDVLLGFEDPSEAGGTTRDVSSEPGAPDEVWRLLTWIEGVCRHRLEGPKTAQAAGRLLGRFHAALADFEAPFAHARFGVHDTERHIAGLRDALELGRAHPQHREIASLGEAIIRAYEALPALPRLEERVVHGDPKISNLLFTPKGEGLALVDLDTLARMPLPLELGDAFRSWCNPAGEDAAAVRFDLQLFEAATTGYAEGSGGAVTREERQAIVTATRTIMVELAARFCRDAIEDRYFGWDPKRFPSRTSHNRVRAEAQLALAADLERQTAEAERIVERAFASP